MILGENALKDNELRKKYKEMAAYDYHHIIDLYEESFFKKRLFIPKPISPKFGIEIDREQLMICKNSIYSDKYPNLIDSESLGICSNYDLWFMIFDMAIYPEFTSGNSQVIQDCALHYNKLYIYQLFCLMSYYYENRIPKGYLPYTYQYYQLRTNYLLDISSFNLSSEYIFIPSKNICPNATTIKLNDSLYGIKINIGLEYFLDKFNRLLHFATINMLDENLMLCNLSIELVLITLFYYGQIKSSQLIGTFMIPYGNMSLCRNRRIEQLDFIFCHEIGHIYNNNVEADCDKSIELQSDTFSLNTLLSQPDSHNLYQLRDSNSIISSILLLFKELEVIENLYTRICYLKDWDFPIQNDSHPSYNDNAI